MRNRKQSRIRIHPGNFGSARNRKELKNETNSGLKLRPESGPYFGTMRPKRGVLLFYNLSKFRSEHNIL